MRPSSVLLTALAALALLPPPALLGQRRAAGRARIDTTVALSRGAEVDLTLLSGRIAVRGWDRAAARVQATSERSGLRFEHSAARLTLREEDGRRDDRGDARYELAVPHGTRVVMRGVSADLAAVDVRGEVEARTTSGDVRVEGASGRARLESVSGSIDARRIAGPLRAQSVSGDVEVAGVSGDVDAETVSGEITLNQARADFVRLETTSGDVRFRGPLARTGRYEFSSHSGTITLDLPANTGARVSLETFSGELDTDFPVTLSPNERAGSARHFDFTLGGGGARVTAESFSGDLNLRRAGSTTSSPD